MILYWASANRDPEIYERPDELILDRVQERPHMTFGAGVHHCPGANFARIELGIVLEELLDRFESIALDDSALHGGQVDHTSGITRGGQPAADHEGTTMRTTDLVIMGAGAAGLSAAIAARARGLDVLVLDKGPVLGGTAAMSGGVLWIPNNPVIRAAGASDSREDALTYLEAAVGDAGPATSRARKETYVDAGGCGSTRDSKMQLLMRNLREALHLPYALTTRAGLAADLKVVGRTAAGKAMGAEKVAMGNALASHLLFQATRLGARFETDTPIEDLVVSGGRVVGVRTPSGEVRARRGVLLAAGGFARNEVMRKTWGPQPSSADHTLVNPDDIGDGITIGIEHGGAVALMDEAIWTPMTMLPDGKPSAVFWERCAPHSLMVNGEGRRFCNESASYMEVGQQMYAHGATPGWIVIDSRRRRRYPFGDALAGITPKSWISSGYLKKAGTVEELARLCELDPAVLRATVDRFNAMCVTGADTDFGRGSSAYDRMEGDDAHRPNPNLGTIEKAPLYAVAINPGDVSTAGGLLTDEHARVLREDGSVIEGLYAAGSTAATVMGALLSRRRGVPRPRHRLRLRGRESRRRPRHHR